VRKYFARRAILALGVWVGGCACEGARSGSPGSPNPGPLPPGSEPTIIVDPTQRFQTIVGWEGTMYIGSPQNGSSLLHSYQDELFERVVEELGLNRIRLSVRSGAQNPIDWFGRWARNEIPYEEWRARRYEIQPQRVYNFTELDFWVEHSVEPFRRRLQARGESLYVNLCYVNFERQVPNQIFHHWDHPEAYGAFMAAAFRHLDQKYGWTPDAVEIVLEPDNVDGWTGTRMGAAMVAAGDSLRAAGYHPDFIAPSTTNMTRAIEFFDEMVQVPGVLSYLKELSYHRYRGVSSSSLETIQQRAAQYGLRTAMLEHIGSGYRDLHEDLKVGWNSAWQQFGIASEEEGQQGGRYYHIEIEPLGGASIVQTERTRFLKLYFRYVRRDAVRVGATSSEGRLDPLAFQNADGSFVVVVKAEESATFSVGGLPPGQYHARYTTEAEDDALAGRYVVLEGEVITTRIPASGVLTIYRD
jgi:hypothetical protein